MILIEFQQPDEHRWGAWKMRKAFLLDTEEGWFQELPCMGDSDLRLMGIGIQLAAQLAGRPAVWLVEREG